MNVIAEVRIGVDRIHDLFHEIARMRSGEPDAADPRELANPVEQGSEIPTGGGWVTIAVDVLPEELHFGVAGFGKPPRLCHHALAGPAALRPARKRDNAVG